MNESLVFHCFVKIRVFTKSRVKSQNRIVSIRIVIGVREAVRRPAFKPRLETGRLVVRLAGRPPVRAPGGVRSRVRPRVRDGVGVLREPVVREPRARWVRLVDGWFVRSEGGAHGVRGHELAGEGHRRGEATRGRAKGGCASLRAPFTAFGFRKSFARRVDGLITAKNNGTCRGKKANLRGDSDTSRVARRRWAAGRHGPVGRGVPDPEVLERRAWTETRS